MTHCSPHLLLPRLRGRLHHRQFGYTRSVQFQWVACKWAHFTKGLWNEILDSDSNSKAKTLSDTEDQQRPFDSFPPRCNSTIAPVTIQRVLSFPGKGSYSRQMPHKAAAGNSPATKAEPSLCPRKRARRNRKRDVYWKVQREVEMAWDDG